MPRPSDHGDTLSTARALVAQGDWEGVRALLSDRPSEVAASADIALLLAEAELRLGNPLRTRELLEGAIPALARAGNRPAHRRAINLLGAANFEVGDLSAAEAHFAQALELGNLEGDALLVARATNNLGAVANVRGRRQAALSMYQLAVPAYQRIGSALGLAESFHNMAITFRDLQRLDMADEYERRALEYAREAGSARLEAMARAGRAELSLLRGEPGVAVAGARRGAREFRAIGDHTGEANALRLAGAAYAALGRPQDALDALDQAIELARRHGRTLIEAEALHTRAELHATAGRSEAALEDARAAMVLYERLGATAERETLAELIERLET